jgi:hypothetical protein
MFGFILAYFGLRVESNSIIKAGILEHFWAKPEYYSEEELRIIPMFPNEGTVHLEFSVLLSLYPLFMSNGKKVKRVPPLGHQVIRVRVI